MRFFVLLLALTTCIRLVAAQPNDAPAAKAPSASALQPSPEMRRLLDTFTGEWNVNETFEIHQTKQGRTREGVCTIKAAPGFSMVENCKTNGSAGELQFLAVLWWDSQAGAYQFFSCANVSGCELRGTARWKGDRLVNSWEEEDKGKKVAYEDSFIDLSPGSFTLVSEGVSDKTTVWRVITKYVRRPGADQQATR